MNRPYFDLLEVHRLPLERLFHHIKCFTADGIGYEQNDSAIRFIGSHYQLPDGFMFDDEQYERLVQIERDRLLAAGRISIMAACTTVVMHRIVELTDSGALNNDEKDLAGLSEEEAARSTFAMIDFHPELRNLHTSVDNIAYSFLESTGISVTTGQTVWTHYASTTLPEPAGTIEIADIILSDSLLNEHVNLVKYKDVVISASTSNDPSSDPVFKDVCQFLPDFIGDTIVIFTRPKSIEHIDEVMGKMWQSQIGKAGETTLLPLLESIRIKAEAMLNAQETNKLLGATSMTAFTPELITMLADLFQD